MGLFDRFRRPPPRVIEDLLFGRLTYREGSWNGQFVLPTAGATVLLGIQAETVEERHHDLVRELDRRYEQLAPPIARALLVHYGGPSDDPVAVRSAEELRALTVLEAVDLLADGSIRLGYAFKDEVDWPDASFSVDLFDWQPIDGFFAD